MMQYYEKYQFGIVNQYINNLCVILELNKGAFVIV